MQNRQGWNSGSPSQLDYAPLLRIRSGQDSGVARSGAHTNTKVKAAEWALAVGLRIRPIRYALKLASTTEERDAAVKLVINEKQAFVLAFPGCISNYWEASKEGVVFPLGSTFFMNQERDDSTHLRLAFSTASLEELERVGPLLKLACDRAGRRNHSLRLSSAKGQ